METVSIFQWTLKMIGLENNDGNDNDSKMTMPMKMTMTMIILMTKAMNMTIKSQ